MEADCDIMQTIELSQDGVQWLDFVGPQVDVFVIIYILYYEGESVNRSQMEVKQL
jgi:hypothetical protein